MNISGDDSCGDLCEWNRWKWDKSSFANQPETDETYHTLGYGRCSSSNCCRTVIFRSVLYLDVKTWFDCGVSGTTNLGYSGARKKIPEAPAIRTPLTWTHPANPRKYMLGASHPPWYLPKRSEISRSIKLQTSILTVPTCNSTPRGFHR